ncbi:hypothetical protein BDV24DRAFT_154661 [Aspergillus arachidicola]|uniref:Chaperonin 10-like protein n=1 Tax=Aspergillus arachidicola TaxID=656916 RepID=A0A5N6XZW4_9EURO|nr:hypothetical protein BDV24DRAFT_154661 [Aspergillus arachidicola]
MQPYQESWAFEKVDIIYAPGDGEILVEICATGICYTDIVLSSFPTEVSGIHFPKVMGHEGSVLLSFSSCYSCTQCQISHPAYCDTSAATNYVDRQKQMKIQVTGEELWSGSFGQSSFARHSIVHGASILDIRGLLHHPDELKLFAPLGCGFQTGVGAIINSANARWYDIVIVLGLGAVGMGSIMLRLTRLQAAKIRGCKMIVAVDKVETRLEIARRLVVIETTGVPRLIEQGLQSTRKQGKLILIGVPPPGYAMKVDVVEHMNVSGFSTALQMLYRLTICLQVWSFYNWVY